MPSLLRRSPPVRRGARRWPARYCRCGHTFGVHDVDRQDCLVRHCGCERFADAMCGETR